jgi:16S rRNA (cytidine1402-2'-O)-methyltransferase
MAALTVSGLPTDRFTFLGFAPARSGERRRWLESVQDLPGTLVYFEAPHRIQKSLESIRDILGERHIVLARELTKAHETVTRGRVSQLLAGPLDQRGEYTILVSDQADGSPETTRPSTETDIARMFGEMTNAGALSTRDAVAAIAERTVRSRQDVYTVLRKVGMVG